jgi:hypothetical protein
MLLQDSSWNKTDHSVNTPAQDTAFATILYRLADLDKHGAYAQGIGKRCLAGEPDGPLYYETGKNPARARTNLSKFGFAHRIDQQRERCVTSWEDYGRLFIGRMQAKRRNIYDKDPEVLGQLLCNMPCLLSDAVFTNAEGVDFSARLRAASRVTSIRNFVCHFEELSKTQCVVHLDELAQLVTWMGATRLEQNMIRGRTAAQECSDCEGKGDRQSSQCLDYGCWLGTHPNCEKCEWELINDAENFNKCDSCGGTGLAETRMPEGS